MKTIPIRSLAKVLLLPALLLLGAGPAARSATIVWTNTVGGNWNVATNWNPNQVPGLGDTANISAAGTYAVNVTVNTSVGTLNVGGAVSGTQTVQSSSQTLTVTNASVNNGGVLGLTNCTFNGPLTIANAGVVSASGATLNSQMTVQGGGVFLAGGSSGIGQGGVPTDTNYWLWVQSGGQLYTEFNGPLYLYSAMTNAGVVNATNYGLYPYNNGSSSYNGGLVNQPGGVINLIGTAGISGAFGSDYLVNQGVINVTNGASTISVDYQTNLGTVATLSGPGTSLRIGTFNGLGSLTGTYNAAAGTVIQFVGGNNPGTSAGAGLVLGGAGQFQFYSGLLTLPTDVIPGLTAMIGGSLLLGPGFQGGAITNLVLDGINLTNSLPIIGTLTMTNGNLYTTNTIGNGTVVSLNNVTMYGAIVVGNGAVLNSIGATLNAQVTVQNGGTLLAGASSGIGQGGVPTDTNYWLWVQSGGQLYTEFNGPLYLYSTMTNAGVVNATNYGLYPYNNGSSSYNGGLLNQPGGVINLIGTAGISGAFGSEYLINQGVINVTNGASAISVDYLTNLGTVATLPGPGTSLRIGTFNGLGSLTGTYDAAAGTVIQFVGGNNPGTSAGAGLTLGGAGQYQFYSGLLTLPTNVIPSLATMIGGTLLLGPGFQGGAITNLVLNGINLTNTLPINGTLTMTYGNLYTTNTIGIGTVVTLNNVTMYGVIVVGNGAVLNSIGATLNAQITVESGGEFVAGDSSNVGQGSLSSDTNNWLWVQSGGQLNTEVSGPLYLYSAMTNAGVVNATNYGLYPYNNGSSGYNGGLLNQPGGVINLIGTAGISGAFGSDYLVNQGVINVTNGASAISVDYLTNLGTVATLSGPGTSLRIGTFSGLGSLTGTYNAAAGTVIQFVGGNNPGTSAGAGLVLGGAGQYQFVSGLLTLPTNVIPSLTSMTGGNLLLGPGFQGGAITNLILDGINLTNTLPINGTLTMTNGNLYTTNTIGSGIVVSLNNVTMYGVIVVGSGAMLNSIGATLNAQVTVESGGEFVAGASSNIGQGGLSNDTNYWLWVQSGGQLNTEVTGPLYLYSAMTNAGVVNATNYGLDVYNNGSSSYNGGLVNQAGGVINLIDTAGVSGGFGSDYLVNQGLINVIGGNSSINVSHLTNAATLNAQLSMLQLQSTDLNLQSGTLIVAVSSPASYGRFTVSGNAVLAGTFGVELTNGYVPVPGASFTVFSYGSYSGAFSSFTFSNQPPNLVWQPIYTNTALILLAHAPIAIPAPRTNVLVNLNGAPGQQAILLTSTNAELPLANWTHLATNTFDATTYLSFTNNMRPSQPYQFFTFKLQ